MGKKFHLPKPAFSRQKRAPHVRDHRRRLALPDCLAHIGFFQDIKDAVKLLRRQDSVNMEAPGVDPVMAGHALRTFLQLLHQLPQQKQLLHGAALRNLTLQNNLFHRFFHLCPAFLHFFIITTFSSSVQRFSQNFPFFKTKSSRHF